MVFVIKSHRHPSDALPPVNLIFQFLSFKLTQFLSLSLFSLIIQIMYPFQSKARLGSQDGDRPNSLLSTSQPMSQLLSRNPVRPRTAASDSPHYSTDSSIDLGRQQSESTANLLQSPRPAFLHHNSSTSSLSSNYDGDTICNTPGPYSGFSTPEHNGFSRSVNSFQKQLDSTSYTIELLDQHDDADLITSWKRKLYRLSPMFTLLAVSAYFVYYGYRIHCTIYAQRAYHKTYVMAWLFIAAEGCVACERVHSPSRTSTD